MLFAKINPYATISFQTSPYTSTTANAEWMTAVAKQYAAGAEFTNFNVYFGILTSPTTEQLADNPSLIPVYQNLYTTEMTFTAQQLSTWGTNDEVLLSIIATSIGATVTMYVDIPEISYL